LVYQQYKYIVLVVFYLSIPPKIEEMEKKSAYQTIKMEKNKLIYFSEKRKLETNKILTPISIKKGNYPADPSLDQTKFSHHLIPTKRIRLTKVNQFPHLQNSKAHISDFSHR
jgi:hypothetical protein